MKYYAVGKGEEVVIVRGSKPPTVTLESVDVPGREISPRTGRWHTVTVRLARLDIKGCKTLATIKKYQAGLYCGKEGTPTGSGDVKEVPKDRHEYIKSILPPPRRRN